MRTDPRDGGRARATAVAGDEFRAAMARYAAGVTVVTTSDEHGGRYGFTASSFCSASAEPPLVLVCVDRSALSFPAFRTCRSFAVSVLAEEQRDVARRFATSGARKFVPDQCSTTPLGLPSVRGALCVLDCLARDRHEAGDHVILVGLVIHAALAEGLPMVWFDRDFRRIERPPPRRITRPGAGGPRPRSPG
ncbi:flavin reductase family protein [Amycolatopsis cihanbeyliensis]|uniref:Flavin reductase ActVB n=1 Tax=Amycolatopsis cihanbeyliensis TaxID=1128664 RepID=A0A542DBS4_AMYCI|nr:flavin reductase family protein [Amycolatopsis cihanbeyliensis]TQJ00516.1 flavin reductase ActVB [Amycolatopsis cihanbeyliensis]